MLSLGVPELLALPVAALMIFGPRRLPKLARSARRTRPEIPSGPGTQLDRPSDRVGLTLRQIQFRGPDRPPPQPEQGRPSPTAGSKGDRIVTVAYDTVD